MYLSKIAIKVFRMFYNKFAKKEKGQKLEELISILFCNSSGSFFDW